MIKSAILLLTLAFVFPFVSMAQEKKVRIKTVKDIDGEKVVTDTMFVVTGDEDIMKSVNQYSWVSDEDSNKVITIDLDIDVDSDEDKDCDKKVHKKVIIMKDGDHGTFFTDDCKEHKVKVITNGGGDENVFFFNGEDFEFNEKDMDELRIKMEKIGDEMENVKFELDAEKIILLEELEGLEELKELEELKNIEVIMSDYHDMGNYHNVWVHDNFHGDRVSEEELRDAGIKVKADRLDIDDYNINIDNGVVDLEFETKAEGTPKVTVYNFYGDKVVTVKPELLGGKYTAKIDLSTKQHGTYYLLFVQNNMSATKKIKL